MSTGQRADPLIGRLVDGRYRVRARIARGGMATVYVATDLRLERRVALKVMHGHLSDDTVFQSRFIQEARAAARLADPHVVNVFDQGQDDDMAYLVMEYLPGITLRTLMSEQKRLSIPQTITIMDAILSGLAAAHRAGIVHRDVKPENVLLAEDGRIKIGDFGLARATTANTASGQMLLGTIAYLAPELVTRGSADARSDIYALGIMLYEMLTGEQPYKGEQPMQIAYQHATDSVPRPSAKNPAVPEQLDELVLWATEREADARPLDADEMLVRLRAIEAELGIAPQVARSLAVGTAVIDDTLDSGELTKALPNSVITGGIHTVTVEADNATRLMRLAKQRSARGGWLLAMVLVLAVIAGGTGWFFGSGPGSLIAVPELRGASFVDAQAQLNEVGFSAVRAEEFDLEVPAETVIRTDPAGGSLLERESHVRIIVSMGPAPHDLPGFSGMSASEVTTILDAAVVSISGTDSIFSDEPVDAILSVQITPRAGGEAFDCTGGCSILEGDSAALIVSLGPLPDVAGKSVTAATTALTEKGLKVDSAEEFSDTIDKGDVIGIAAAEGALRPGDTVTLRVSKGPELFEVPRVVGMTRDEAKSALERTGFKVSYNPTADMLPNGLTTVKDQNPAAGTRLSRGSTVNLTITATLL